MSFIESAATSRGARGNTEPRGSAPPHFYRPELDVLRLFAFLCVYFTHTSRPPIHPGDPAWEVSLKQVCALLQETGSFGMCIFFLLSAYLITELLQRERQSTGDVHLRAFYVRRILRIWPLYFLALLLGALVSRMGPQEWIGPWRMLSFLFLAGNWYTAFRGYATNPIAPLWSISLEEQFYLIWPGIAKLGGRRALLLASFIVIPVGLGTLFYLRAKGVAMQPALWTNSFVQFPMFAIGALLALFLRGRTPSITPLLRPVVFCLGIALWLVADGHFKILWGVPGGAALCLGSALAALGCVAIFLSLLGVSARNVPGPLIYLGKISYGLYVFAPFSGIVLARILPGVSLSLGWAIVLQLTTTIILASLSYRYFEKPFLRLKRRFEFVLSRKA